MYYPPSPSRSTIRPTSIGEKRQTDPASSTILSLEEDERINELARMTGGVEINDTTLQHAKQLRQLKFQSA